MLGVAVFAAAMLAGCGSDEPDEIVVSAASSLTDAFTDIAEAFEEENGTTATLNFGASSELAVQIVEGAPADVFASANAAQMNVVVDAGKAEDPVAFVQNEIVIVTPAGREAVTEFEDLAADGIRLVLAGPEVPVGEYARDAIAAADEALGNGFGDAVLANVVSEEANVRAVLSKIELGEADAGIVYATDAAISGDAVETYRIPAEYAEPAEYFIAPLVDSGDAAQEFVDYILSDAGQAILAEYGFSRAGGE